MCTDGQPRMSSTDVLCVLTDKHGRPVCADGHPRTSCPTWAKITRTVHGKGQRAESKDQRADMCTDGQPRPSCVCWRTPTDVHPRGPKSPEQSTGRVSVLSPRTNVLVQSPRTNMLICVLMDSHGRPVCAGTHRRTHTDSHGCPVCADGQPQTATDVLCVLADTHGRHVRTEQTAKQSTGRASVLSPRTNMLVCVLMDSHRHSMCADRQRRTHTDTNGQQGRPVCAGGHPRTSCVY
ncbi:unnamed protein product [Brassica rapa]|uniref:Uncharacterized protein n=1 Tax=Brassica campestris TaxID=3711 RepID=A0A8D9CUM5_BRACM|nr:unnamed protein product [Brassica rapa]